MYLPPAEQKYQLTAGKAVVVPCAAKGSVIRVSTDGTLTLCDIYPIITSNTASPSPAPDTNMTSMPVSMTVLGRLMIRALGLSDGGMELSWNLIPRAGTSVGTLAPHLGSSSVFAP